MYDVITIGSAVVDIFIHSPEFQLHASPSGTQLCQMYGDKIELDRFEMHTGGAATNTAVGLARAGLRVAAIAELGKDPFAETIVQELRQEKVGVEYLIKEKHEKTGGSVILVGDDGGRTVMVHRGAAAMLEASDLPATALHKTRWIHLSSLGGQLSAIKHVFQTAREQSLGLSWNPGKGELALLQQKSLSELGFHCQLLCLNQEEWKSITHLHQKLIAAVETIIITNGHQPGTLYHKAQAQTFTVEKAPSVDDTGAGDAFVTGFVAATLYEYPPTTALSWAKANAASVVQSVGAKPGLLSHDELVARAL